MELETLQGNLTASKSKLEADRASLETEERRRRRAEQELKDCVIKAERSGLVIYPSAAAWKNAPDITEGATVLVKGSRSMAMESVVRGLLKGEVQCC